MLPSVMAVDAPGTHLLPTHLGLYLLCRRFHAKLRRMPIPVNEERGWGANEDLKSPQFNVTPKTEYARREDESMEPAGLRDAGGCAVKDRS
jgi:hypothetical protein